MVAIVGSVVLFGADDGGGDDVIGEVIVVAASLVVAGMGLLVVVDSGFGLDLFGFGAVIVYYVYNQC